MPALEPLHWLALAVVTLFAGAVQAATGFGFAVIAVPLFLLVLDSLAAVQIGIVLNLANALAVAPRLWGVAPHALLLRLGVGVTLGLPLGLLLWRHADLEAVKVAVAVVVLALTARLVLHRRAAARREPPARPVAAVWVGGAAGAMGTCLAMPGPPVLLYMAGYRLSKERLRSTTLTLYIYAYAAALALHAGAGGMARETWAVALPLAALAAVAGVLGHRLSRHVSEDAFRVAIVATLLATGLYTLWSALARPA